MKIAIVWEQAEWGGVDSYLAYLIESWPDQKDSFTVYFNKQNKGADRLRDLISDKRNIDFIQISSSIPNVNALGITKKVLKFLIHLLTPIFFLVSIVKYRILFRNKNYEALLAQNGGYPGSYGVIASLFAARMANIPVRCMVVHHRAVKPDLFHGWFRMWVEKKLSVSLNTVITPSKATFDSIGQNTRITDDQRCPVIIIENGTLLNDDNRQPKKSGDGKVRVGMLGRLESYKGHDDLLCAVSLLPKSLRERLILEFVGGYSDADYLRLNKIANELELSRIVNFRGYVKGSPSSIILKLDLVAMLSKTFEGFGLTVVEALHCGVPVLATPLGVVPELFDMDHELIVNVGNVQEIATALEKFINHRNRNEYIFESAREKLWRYNAEYMASRYRQHLQFELKKNLNF